jgi:hypothetical protein
MRYQPGMQMLASGDIHCPGRFPDDEVDLAQVGLLTESWLSDQRGAIKLLDLHRLPHEAEVVAWKMPDGGPTPGRAGWAFAQPRRNAIEISDSRKIRKPICRHTR